MKVNAALLHDTSLNMPSYTEPVLISDSEMNSKIRSLNQKMEKETKKSIKAKSISDV